MWKQEQTEENLASCTCVSAQSVPFCLLQDETLCALNPGQPTYCARCHLLPITREQCFSNIPCVIVSLYFTILISIHISRSKFIGQVTMYFLKDAQNQFY